MVDETTEAVTQAAIKPAPDKWRPSFGDIVTVLALVAAIIMWFAPPNWKIGIPVVVASIALVAITALRHASNAFLRGTAAVLVVAILVAVAWRPIWESFHKDYPNVAFHWPISFGDSEQQSALSDPPDIPPLNLPGPTLSKWGKVLYLCPFPAKVDRERREEVKAAIRRNADIYGNAMGFDFVFNEIPYGIRFDITAKTPQGTINMGGGALQRVTIQLEAASQGIFATITMNLAGGMGMLESVSLDRDSNMEKLWKSQVERIAGVPEGKCRLL
jgi:hypothetical protein